MLLAGGLGLATAAHTAPALLAPCRDAGLPPSARCGRVAVPEDRTASAGRTLDLAVVVIPARRSPAAPDPIVFLAGGPGEAATADAAGIAELFAAALERRDLVLVDLRGTGDSAPLRCPSIEGNASRPGAPGPSFDRSSVEACRRELAAGADLRRYTTEEAIADLEAVRAALGYQQVNLLGVSYGTIAAQVYLRRAPQRVRAAVLIAPLPLSPEALLFYARDTERALGLLFAACAADPGCHAAFPDPGQALRYVLARLDRAPVEVELADPQSGQPMTVRFDRESFVATLRTRLFSPEAAARVPRALAQAAQGDFRDMARAAVIIGRLQGRGTSWGFFLSVMCSEVFPFLDPSAISRLSRDTVLGAGRVLAWRQACDAWPRATVPEEHLAPVRSAVPALLVSGGLDPVCPPYWGEQVAAFLSNGRQVTVDQASHFPVDECVAGLIARFIDAGSAAGIDTSCAEAVRRPSFALR